jgi:periplasmic protein CpxP/Spy
MKTLVAVLASTFLVSNAYADLPGASAGAPPSTVASTPAMVKTDAQRNMEVEKHIQDLHAKLKITSAEESQWADVVRTMRDNAMELDKAIDKRKATVSSGTAIDDLNAYGEIAQVHADNVKKLSAAFSPLYASMPDAQKRVADEVFAQRPQEQKKVAKTTN